MKCIYCGNRETRVADKRDIKDSTRRRRECTKCRKRFTTYEAPESVNITIVKKDSRREPYQREKLTKGIRIACQKRPISADRIEKIVADVENSIKERKSNEIPSQMVGELVMKKLKSTDKVAYIRFASVYRDFEDIQDFKQALKQI